MLFALLRGQRHWHQLQHPRQQQHLLQVLAGDAKAQQYANVKTICGVVLIPMVILVVQVANPIVLKYAGEFLGLACLVVTGEAAQVDTSF